MMLLTQANRNALPQLGTYNGQGDAAIAQVKFFTPDAQWTWYATEYDPSTEMFFGLVVGMETEWGYFTLAELEEARGPMGLKVERDMYFSPTPISKVRP